MGRVRVRGIALGDVLDRVRVRAIGGARVCDSSSDNNSKYISQIVYPDDLDGNDQLSVQSSMSLPQDKEVA